MTIRSISLLITPTLLLLPPPHTSPLLPHTPPPHTHKTTCSALGNSYEEKYQARLNEIRGEIEEKGSYEHTYEEIVFGARMAWRNAPRCVNRIVWRQLEVMPNALQLPAVWLVWLQLHGKIVFSRE